MPVTQNRCPISTSGTLISVLIYAWSLYSCPLCISAETATCRLCTRSTIWLHDEEFREPLNGTGTQRRHLLSKNSVTAAFSAQSLWAAGYQGKGVKMGVFDTGIRDDHPHVKNIKCGAFVP